MYKSRCTIAVLKRSTCLAPARSHPEELVNQHVAFQRSWPSVNRGLELTPRSQLRSYSSCTRPVASALPNHAATDDAETPGQEEEISDSQPFTPLDHSFLEHAPLPTNKPIQTFEERWAPSPRRRGKLDLSYWNTRHGERKNVFPDFKTLMLDTPQFRAQEDRIARSLTRHFMQQGHAFLSSHSPVSDTAASSLLYGLSHSRAAYMVNHAADLMVWSWILLSTPNRGVQRLLALSNSPHPDVTRPVPLWVVLQMLRSTHLHAQSLVQLLLYIDRHLHMWKWNGEPAMLLVVRLLRLARTANGSSFEAIVATFINILSLPFPDCFDLETVTHWCNRMLTLLALPAASHPFRMMKFQQDAQLALIAFMEAHQPQIPLTREGYRGIAILQLMHAKTPDESEWARAKTGTWPPFEERVKMGAALGPTYYPGRVSRAAKVLKRMQEDGYAPHAYDAALQVLAGWDTDRSPTIQVRRTGALISGLSRWQPGLDQPFFDQSSAIWAARVDATRTLREAWMCFCSYANATSPPRQAHEVYEVMFQKLFASKQPQLLDSGPVPGDGIEVYPDPDLPRDWVYIPEPIPSIEELFDRMIHNGVKPRRKLLTKLLFHEQFLLQHGMKFISGSTIRPCDKNVLTNPQSHSARRVAEVLDTMHEVFAAAYIHLLARPHALHTAPAPMFLGPNSAPIAGAVFAMLLLDRLEKKHPRAYNSYFVALAQHLKAYRPPRHRFSVHNVWELACKVLLTQAVPLRFLSFRAIAWIAYSYATYDRELETLYEPLTITKLLWKMVLSGTNNLSRSTEHWLPLHQLKENTPLLSCVPSGDDIEALVWVLGASQTETGENDIVNLLHWTRVYLDQISQRQHLITRHNLAAFRLFLEGIWADEKSRSVRPVQALVDDRLEGVWKLINEIGEWPDDGYMVRYMQWNQSKLDRLRKSWQERRLPTKRSSEGRLDI